jgi:hypothetical protein
VKYDIFEKYKVFFHQSQISNEISQRSISRQTKVTIKLKNRFRSTDRFIQSIIEARNKDFDIMRGGNQSELGISNRGMMIYNEDDVSNSNILTNSFRVKEQIPKLQLSNMLKSRNNPLYHNIYSSTVNNTNNQPFQILDNNYNNKSNKLYHTTERANKQKSLVSTIHHDVEVLDNFINSYESIAVDAVPIKDAIKPGPKSPKVKSSSIDEHNSINFHMKSSILNESRAVEEPICKVVIKDPLINLSCTKKEEINTEIMTKQLENDQDIVKPQNSEIIKDNYFSNDMFREKEKIFRNSSDTIFKIDSRRCEYPKYFCCK